MATPPFRKNLRGHAGLSVETCVSNLKSVALTVLELLAFNVQNVRGSRDPGHASFTKRVMFGLSTETSTSNLKSLALTLLELLAFNANKFRGSHDPGHAPFSKNF